MGSKVKQALGRGFSAFHESGGPELGYPAPMFKVRHIRAHLKLQQGVSGDRPMSPKFVKRDLAPSP